MKRSLLLVALLSLGLVLGACSDGTTSDKCGNGTQDPGEICDGNCPSDCNDSDACTIDSLTGSALTCDAVCSYADISECTDSDGCCPTGCTSADDNDCGGDPCAGVVDCINADGCCPAACDVGNDDDCVDPCADVVDCINADGCCPAGCDSGTDDDCLVDPCAGVVDCINADGCCPAGCDSGNDDDCIVDPCAGVVDCINADGCCPAGCDSGNDDDCFVDPCEGVVDCINADGCCPAGCDSGNDDDCAGDPCAGVVDCINADGCCPAGCDVGSDDDCATCDAMAAIRATADGVVDLNMCPVLVTYVAHNGYFVQEGPSGPAINIYEDNAWVADVATGDMVRMHVTELSDFNGLKEVTIHDPVVVLSSNNPVVPQSLNPDVTPSEDLESELVQVTGAEVAAIDGSEIIISYGAVTDVQLRISGQSAIQFCPGATFDFIGPVTEFLAVYQLRSFDDGDITNFDDSSCADLGRAPVAGDLVLNEYMADPPADLPGDANCDGTRDSGDDEFIEIVNISADALDLSGVTVSDGQRVRHTFLAVGLPAGEALVLFGGGAPACNFPASAHVYTASSGISLNNAGDTISLATADDSQLLTLTYTTVEGNADMSMTLNPDLNLAGGYVTHESATTGVWFSPGAKVDGSAF